MRVLHVLSSNSLSGAERVAIDIIEMSDGIHEMIYASPEGSIVSYLKEKGIAHKPIGIKLFDKKLSKIVNELQPDIIHSHDMSATLKVSLIKSRKPIVAHLHGNPLSMSKISIRSIVFLLLSLNAKRIIAVSNSIVEDYFFSSLINKKKISILPNIINIQNIKYLIEQDKSDYNCDFLYLGRLTYPKNPERMAQIVSTVLKENPKLKFGVIGDGDLKQNVIDIFKEEGVIDQVNFFGFVKNPYKILLQSKALIMSSRYEGTPLAALEALSLGVPIVTTPVDGLKRIVVNERNGFISEDNQLLIDGLRTLMNNRQKQIQMSGYSVISAEPYINIDKYYKKLETIYNNFISS
ncbi:glycosyltransferase [Paenibacillus sp. strain BS8-2]